MDDGYANHLAEYDRAELAEQKLAVAVAGLNHVRRRFPHTEPMVRLTLKQVKEHKLHA